MILRDTAHQKLNRCNERYLISRKPIRIVAGIKMPITPMVNIDFEFCTGKSQPTGEKRVDWLYRIRQGGAGRPKPNGVVFWTHRGPMSYVHMRTLPHSHQKEAWGRR